MKSALVQRLESLLLPNWHKPRWWEHSSVSGAIGPLLATREQLDDDFWSVQDLCGHYGSRKYFDEALVAGILEEVKGGLVLETAEWQALSASTDRRAEIIRSKVRIGFDVLVAAQLGAQGSSLSPDQVRRIYDWNAGSHLDTHVLLLLHELAATSRAGFAAGSLLDWLHLLVAVNLRGRWGEPDRVSAMAVTLRELQASCQLQKEATAGLVRRLAEIVTVPQLLSVQVSLLQLLDGETDAIARGLLKELRAR